MSPLVKTLVLGAAAALLAARAGEAATFAMAGQSSNQISVTDTAPHKASALSLDENGFARANAYEFDGGVGVSASFASTLSTRSSITMGADASASLTDTFVIRGGNFIGFDEEYLDSIIYFIDYRIIAEGSVSTSNAPVPQNRAFHSQAVARYNYSWTVGEDSGQGLANSEKLFRGAQNSLRVDGPSAAAITGFRGTEVPIAFSVIAEAGGIAYSGAPSSGNVQFDHTLRWGGVTAVTAVDRDGMVLDLPEDFRLSLIGRNNGFDYWNPAPENPFVAQAGVPEPGSWALMILGFGAVGAMVRRRAVSAA